MRTTRRSEPPFSSPEDFFRETGLMLKFFGLTCETAMKRALSRAGFCARRIEREEFHKLTTIRASRATVDEQRNVR